MTECEHKLELHQELLFSITDFMHDEQIFTLFTNKELNDFFLKARLITKYGKKGTVEELKEFISFFKKNYLIKLYPSYHKDDMMETLKIEGLHPNKVVSECEEMILKERDEREENERVKGFN